MKPAVKKVIYTILIIVSCILFAISLFLRLKFGNPQFEQVIDTMYSPKGSSIAVILDGVCFSLPIVFVLLCVLLIPIYLKNNKIKKGIYTLVISLFLCIYSLLSMGFFKWCINMVSTSTIFEDYYVNPKDVEITFPEERKNLIYIYMESMESSFSSFTFDGKKVNVIPNLTKIANDNINFSNTKGLGGAVRIPLTTWTVAGTVAQMGGIPLKSSMKRNKYGLGSDEFLPGAIMLGDILEDAGYHNYYLLGSNDKFAGTKALLESHGNFEIFDYKWAKEEGRIAKDYKVNWGFEDSKLYRMAKEELLRISRDSEEPFNFTMITIDTHAVDGYTDKSCQKEYDYKYANSLNCADTMLNDFLLWLQEQDFYDDTVVIISGDHLTMQSNVKDYLTDADNRTIYNAFINTGITPVKSKNRLFSSVDMFPTTLAALGVDIEGNRLGLGVNLFSDEETLIEKLGPKEFSNEISKKSKYYDKYLLN